MQHEIGHFYFKSSNSQPVKRQLACMPSTLVLTSHDSPTEHTSVLTQLI